MQTHVYVSPNCLTQTSSYKTCTVAPIHFQTGHLPLTPSIIRNYT